jgi:PadR family transcriptional regulator PadR
MAKSSEPTLLQGTLDLLVLHALQRGAMHGYAIAQTIHLLSDNVLTVEEGSLYPALYRLELDGAISAKWGLSENNRKAKYYEITKRGPQTGRATASHLDPPFGRRPARACQIDRHKS